LFYFINLLFSLPICPPVMLYCEVERIFHLLGQTINLSAYRDVNQSSQYTANWPVRSRGHKTSQLNWAVCQIYPNRHSYKGIYVTTRIQSKRVTALIRW